MLAVRCALLTALLAAPGAALAPGGCPTPGKGFSSTWRAEPAGRWWKPLWPPQTGAGVGGGGRRGAGFLFPRLA